MQKDKLIKENESLMMDLYYKESESRELKEENEDLKNHISCLLEHIEELTQENLSLEKRFRLAHALN